MLVASPNIYKQIAGSFLFFAIMAGALWSFHPAFKISSSPLIIILAFAIIFMSLVVIGLTADGKVDRSFGVNGTARAGVDGCAVRGVPGVGCAGGRVRG